LKKDAQHKDLNVISCPMKRRVPILEFCLTASIVIAIGAAAPGAPHHDSTPAQDASSPSNRSGLPWKSGVSPGTSKGVTAIEKINGFGAWRGRPVDIAAVFIGKNSWQKSYEAYLTNEVLRPDGAVAALKQAGVLVLLTVPLVTKSDAGQFAMVAHGDIDAKHQAVAAKIRSLMGDETIYLRLGHEADEGYPWSYTGHRGSAPDPANPAEYRAAWARIAHIYKQTVPNAKMVWNVLKNTRQKIGNYYPGDAVVDVLSIDVYDNGYGGFCDSPTAPGWIKTGHGSYNPQSGVSKGAAGLLSFAKLHNKRIGIDEWGATNKPLDAGDGANNAFFVQGMYDFFVANGADIEYECYFNRAGGGTHQIWPKTQYNPLPSDGYLKGWKPVTEEAKYPVGPSPKAARRKAER
jgi:hypothetical protein